MMTSKIVPVIRKINLMQEIFFFYLSLFCFSRLVRTTIKTSDNDSKKRAVKA